MKREGLLNGAGLLAFLGKLNESPPPLLTGVALPKLVMRVYPDQLCPEPPVNAYKPPPPKPLPKLTPPRTTTALLPPLVDLTPSPVPSSPSRTNPVPPPSSLSSSKPSPKDSALDKSKQLFWNQFSDSPACSPNGVTPPQTPSPVTQARRLVKAATTAAVTATVKRRTRKKPDPKEQKSAPASSSSSSSSSASSSASSSSASSASSASASAAAAAEAAIAAVAAAVAALEEKETAATLTSATTARTPRTPKKKVPLPRREERPQTRMIIRKAGAMEARLMPKRGSTTVRKKPGRPPSEKALREENATLTTAASPMKETAVNHAVSSELSPETILATTLALVNGSSNENTTTSTPATSPQAPGRLTRSAAKLLKPPPPPPPPPTTTRAGEQVAREVTGKVLAMMATQRANGEGGKIEEGAGKDVREKQPQLSSMQQMFGDDSSGDELEALDMASGSSSSSEAEIEDEEEEEEQEEQEQQQVGEIRTQPNNSNNSNNNNNDNNNNSSKKRGRRGGAIEQKKQSKKQAKRTKRKQEHEAKIKAKHDKEQDKYRLECKFWQNGACKNGDACPYAHLGTPIKSGELCRFFLSGACTKGDDCMYSHTPSSIPCKFFHFLKGGCSLEEKCNFSHAPITEEQRKQFEEEEEIKQRERAAARVTRDPRQEALEKIAIMQPFGE